MGNPYASEQKRKSSFGSYFDFSGYDNVKFFKANEAGSYAVDIIPFPISSKDNIMILDGTNKLGDPTHVLDYYIHKNVGPLKQAIVCPSKTANKPCPICDEYERVKKEKGWNSEEAKALKPSRRSAYNVVDADGDDSTIQIFDVSEFLFGQELNDEAEAYAKDNDMEFLDYAGVFNSKDAMTIEFRGSEKAGAGGSKFVEFKSFKFVPRENSYKKLEPIPLDKCLIIKKAEEIEKLFYGEGEDDAADKVAEPEPSVRRSRSAKPEEDVEEDEPPRRARGRAVEEDETPKGKETECPNGLKFGKDCDKKRFCEDCEVYSECNAAYQKLKQS